MPTATHTKPCRTEVLRAHIEHHLKDFNEGIKRRSITIAEFSYDDLVELYKESPPKLQLEVKASILAACRRLHAAQYARSKS